MRAYIVEFPRLVYNVYNLDILYRYNRTYGLPGYMESNEEDSSLAIF